MHRVVAPSAVFRERAVQLAAHPRGSHLAPLVAAVGSGLALLTVVQTDAPFRVPRDQPAIVLIGDDTDVSRGPNAFHGPSLRRALRGASHVAIMAGPPAPPAYAAAVAAALLGRGVVVLIECQESTEGDWHALVGRFAARAAVLIVTTNPAGHA